LQFKSICQRFCEEGTGCKLVTSDTRRKAPAPPEGLHLWDRFTALKAEEELGVFSSVASGLTYLEPCRSIWKKSRVTAEWGTPCCVGQRHLSAILICHLK